MKNENIARIVHAANNELRRQLGESVTAYEDLKDHEIATVLQGIQKNIENPHMTAEQSHDSWCADKFAQGWVYGKVKDAEAKTHPCLVEYCELPTEQQLKDFLFKGIVTSLLEGRKVLYPKENF